MDGGAWWAAVHGVTKSRTRLSDFTFTFHFHALQKEMATHSSVLAWRIPGMGEPGGLPSLGSHRDGHDWSGLAAAAAAAVLLFSRPVMFNSLRPHGLQHARPLCLLLSPEVCPSSCPLHWWCYPAISSSDSLFSCPQSFPASGTFPMSQLFALDGQTTGVSASALVLSTSVQGWFSLRLTCCPGDSQESSPAPQFEGINSSCSAFFTVQLLQPYWPLGRS